MHARVRSRGGCLCLCGVRAVLLLLRFLSGVWRLLNRPCGQLAAAPTTEGQRASAQRSRPVSSGFWRLPADAAD